MAQSHQPCPDCGSSDALMINDDGSTYCFSCEKFTPAKNVQEDEKTPADFVKGYSRAIPQRGLNKDTCTKYKYNSSEYKGQPVQIATYKDLDGIPVFQKLRFPDKTFTIIGDFRPILYGKHLFKGESKKLIITEGEIDCLSVYQINGGFPVVSIPNGAQGAKKAIQHELKFVEQFSEVILMFDMDEAGQKAVKECAPLISVGKVKIASLPEKDANECLKKGKIAEVIKAIYNAIPYRPDGIAFGAELWDEVTKPVEYGFNYPWERLTELTYGIRTSEMLAIAAGTGIGKTSIITEIAYELAVNQKHNVGIIRLEDARTKVTLDFMSKYLNKCLHKPGVFISEKDRREAFDNTIGTNRVFIYDSKGSKDFDIICSMIRIMVKSYGCKFIIFDHIKVVLDALSVKDKIAAADKIISDLNTLIQELDCFLIVCTHLRKTTVNTKSFEEGARIHLDDFYGAGALKQYANYCIGVERNKNAVDRNIRNKIRLRFLKDRYTGEADGEVVYLNFIPETGRVIQAVQQKSADDLEDFEEGTNDF